MRKILLLLLPLLLVTLAVGACTSAAVAPPTKIIEEAPPEVFVEGDMFDPEAFYAAICSNCHGVGYDGGIGPSLIAHGMTPDEVEELLKEGRPGTVMPHFDGVLSLEQIQVLSEWVCESEDIIPGI